MIIEDAVDFFREAPPLSLLEPARLAPLARRASLDFFPEGTRVLGPGGAGEGFVLAVKKGVLRAGGEDFGEGSVLGWTAVEADAIEDCVCYLLPPEDVAEALSGRPELFDFLEGRLSPGVLELGLAGVVREIPAWLSRRPLASVTAGEALRPGAPVTAGTPLRETARIMSATARDAVVVLGNDGRPAGVVTDRDFRSKAVEQGLSPDTPVEAVMTSPVVSVDADSSCFDALMAMTRHHIRHVVVMAGKLPAGVLSAQELLLKQVGSPPGLAARVAGAASVEELARVAEQLDPLALGLLREGARASGLGRIVGGLREALASRACQLAQEVLGPPPAGYALLLMGRAARREGPALCPMWHGVVHEEAPGGEGWFERLGAFLSEAFEIANLAGAPGAPAAESRSFRGTPAQWRERLTGWVQAGHSGQAGSFDPGWLDFRPVHGQLCLGEALRAHLSGLMGSACRTDCVPDGADLAESLAGTARTWALRLGLSRIASVERSLALDQLRPLGAELAHALEYLTARQWVGEGSRRSPMARAMERMCRNAARRVDDEMVALVRP
jgi:CBS domain-containing protein